MSDENEKPISAEDAFNQAAIGYSFGGETLLPWSGSREIAAQAMGMKAPYISAEDEACLAENRPYPGAARDVIIALWICSTKNASELTVEEVKAKTKTVQWARNNPAAAYDEAEKWGIERGLNKTRTEKFVEAFQTVAAMLSGKAVSEFEVKVEGESGGSSEGKV